MSELNEPKWSVISERGCEALALRYDEAVQLERKLKDEKVHGLSIVSDQAGRRMARNEPVQVK